MQSTARVNSIHAIRAIAALLGVAIHDCFAYTVNPIPEWGLSALETRFVFDYWASWIHMFRLPVFFFLAGFLGYESLQRLTVFEFIKRRFLRIAVPFSVIVAILNFPSFLMQIYLHGFECWKYLWLLFYNLRYLWFLQYLLTFYAITLFLHLCIKILKPTPFLVTTDRIIRQLLKSPALWALLIMINSICLYTTHSLYTPVLLKFVPSASLLIIYFLSFSFGWYLAKNEDLVTTLFNCKIWYCIPGIMTTAIYFYFLFYTVHSENSRMLIVFLYALCSWFWFYFFITFCMKYFTRNNTVLKYLSGASYWIYLIHVPIVGYLQTRMIKTYYSAFIQYFLIFAITLAICLITYHLFVRETAIGDPSLPRRKMHTGMLFAK